MIESRNILRSIFYFIYYRTFRRWTPKRLALVNNEYTVYGPRIFDPHTKDKINDHEKELLTGVRMVVDEGDNVVIVGGGLGVSTLVAAECVGSNGNVQTFEASEEIAGYLSKTVSLNDFEEQINVSNAAVGPIKNLWGRPGNLSSINPEDIPICDVLVLDCEGAEKEIIEKFDHKPGAIVVEYHADLGVSENEARTALRQNGYNIINHDIEIADRGIGILTAKYKP